MTMPTELEHGKVKKWKMKYQHIFKFRYNISVIRNGPYCIIRVAYNTNLGAYCNLYRLITLSLGDKVFESFAYVIYISSCQQNLKNNEQLSKEAAVYNFIQERRGTFFVIA